MRTDLNKKISPCEERPRLAAGNESTRAGLPDFCRYGIGLDVHKDLIAVCVSGQIPSGEIVEAHQHAFRNDHPGIGELCRFLSRFGQDSTILMECTGVYHVAVYRALQQAFPDRQEHIIAMNPLLVHSRISDLGNKNDKADARSLASLAFYEKILRPSYIGSAEFFSLRDLMRSYHSNTTAVTRLKNRIHRQLHLANQKFTFDLDAEWGLQLLDYYISKGWGLGECFESLLESLKAQGKGAVLEKRAPDIIRNGEVALTEEQRFLLQLDLLRLLNAQQAGAVLLQRAERLVLAHPALNAYYQQLHYVPGFSATTILTLLTEIGDYTRFANSKAFVKYCGVVPSVEQSATKVSKRHINRFTNKHIRLALTMAASVILARPNPMHDIGAFAYRQRQLRKLPFKRCMLKVAQKYARIVYTVLTDRHKYDPVFEVAQKAQQRLQRQLQRQNTLLDSAKTRAVRRNIQSFLVSHSELLNSTSRYHLVSGFHRVIQRSKYMDRQKQANS